MLVKNDGQRTYYAVKYLSAAIKRTNKPSRSLDVSHRQPDASILCSRSGLENKTEARE